MSEVSINLYASTLAVVYNPGDGQMTVTSAAGLPAGVASYTIAAVNPAGNVILLFRVSSRAGVVLTGAPETTDVMVPNGTAVRGSILSVAAIAALLAGAGGALTLPYLGIWLNALTDPNLLAYTWFNQAGSSIATNGVTLQQQTPDSGGNNISGRQTPLVGAAPYTWTIGFVPNASAFNFSQCGIVITDTVNYRLIRWRGENGGGLEAWSWTGTGTPNAQIGPSSAGFSPPMVFLRIKETVATRFFQFGDDGVNFYTIASEAAGAGIVPTRGGFFCLGNGQASAMTVTHALLTAP